MRLKKVEGISSMSWETQEMEGAQRILRSLRKYLINFMRLILTGCQSQLLELRPVGHTLTRSRAFVTEEASLARVEHRETFFLEKNRVTPHKTVYKIVQSHFSIG